MLAYAGIGSRTITNKEEIEIKNIASLLSKKYIVYSGNAQGSDISFQEGSGDNCVVFLPWEGFNLNVYNTMKEAIVITKETDPKSYESVPKYHPKKNNIDEATKKLMARNFNQVIGHSNYPPVKFVLCCADQDNRGVLGGTGQAIRIADDLGIPVVNIREDNWKKKLLKILKYIENEW